MKRILLKSEEAKTRPEICNFLRELADKIESNTVTLQQGKEKVKLEIPEQLELEIEVEERQKAGKETKMELEIELGWYKGEKQKITLA